MPELGGDYTLDTILEEMQKSGYSGTELGNKFPKEASSIKEVLSKYKLKDKNKIIVTGDHDFYQLVDDNCILYSPN